MTLPLTPDRIALMYDFLSECPPFCDWHLPHSEDVIFQVTRSGDTCGEYRYRKKTGQHVIRISQKCVGWTAKLADVVGHEMIHLYQKMAKMETGNVVHNAAFLKLAKQVADVHGFDPHQFV